MNANSAHVMKNLYDAKLSLTKIAISSKTARSSDLTWIFFHDEDFQ